MAATSFKPHIKLVMEPGAAARLVDDSSRKTLVLTVLEGQVLALMNAKHTAESLAVTARAAGLDVDVRQVESLLVRAEQNGFMERASAHVTQKGEVPPLSADDVAPAFRSDLQMTAGPKPGLFRIEDPLSGNTLTLHDFEVHVARLLDGKHKVSEVIALAAKIGVTLSVESLHTFIAQMRTYGLMLEWWSESTTPGASTWPTRQKWTADIRELYQSALRLYRQGRAQHALEYLDMLLEIQPQTPEALELKERVKVKLNGAAESDVTFETLHGLKDEPLPALTPMAVKAVLAPPPPIVMAPASLAAVPAPPATPAPRMPPPPAPAPAPPPAPALAGVPPPPPPPAPLAKPQVIAPLPSAPPPASAFDVVTNPGTGGGGNPANPADESTVIRPPKEPAQLGAAPAPAPFVPTLPELELENQPHVTNPSQPKIETADLGIKPKRTKKRGRGLIVLGVLVVGLAVPVPSVKGVETEVKPVVIAEVKVAGGTFHTLLARPGQHVDVGGPLADLDTGSSAEQKGQLERELLKLEAGAVRAEERAKPEKLAKAKEKLAKAERAFAKASEDKRPEKQKALEKAQKAYDEANGVQRAADMRAQMAVLKPKVAALQKEVDGGLVTSPAAGAFEPGPVPPAGAQFDPGAVLGRIVDEHKAVLVGAPDGAETALVSGKRLTLSSLKQAAGGFEVPYDGLRPHTATVDVKSGWAPWTLRFVPVVQEQLAKLTGGK
jgi:hypothetical protein